MICSVSPGKSDSGWLDRLRSNKGFPTGDDHDLDHFLRNNNDNNPNPNPESNSSESAQSDSKRVLVVNRKASTETCSGGGNGDEKEEWFGLMNNVLSDLFNMGEPSGSSRLSGKKSSRKQTKPKLCLVSRTYKSNAEEQSSGCARKDENAQEMKEEEGEEEEDNVNNLDCGDVEEEEDGESGERELFGYSRNEVTVIDTSFPEWKVEKLVYRRRNVWKVREKKGKSRIVGRKKRKANEVDGNADGKKKVKVFSGGGTDCAFASKHGESPQSDKGKEFGKETSDELSQVSKKRFQLPRLPKKTKKGSSSVILIKGMPTNKKNRSKKSQG